MSGLQLAAGGAGAAGAGFSILSLIQGQKAASNQIDTLKDVREEALIQDEARSARLRGTIRTKLAGSGVAPSGTALDLLSQAAEQAELDQLRVKFRFDTQISATEQKKQQDLISGIASIAGTAALTGAAVGGAGGGTGNPETILGSPGGRGAVVGNTFGTLRRT